MKWQQIVEEASKLPEEERATLASCLLRGLKTAVYDVSDDEVQRRVEEADANPEALIAIDELMDGLRRSGD